MLLEMRLDLSELVEKLIVHKDLQVFHVIISLIGAFELLLWLTRIYSLQDAETSEILKSKLKLADCLGASEVLGLLSLLPLLDLLRHYILSSLFL